ncbi:MAG TPA: uracil-DNA glycosylase [Geobacteraceae bacterium]
MKTAAEELVASLRVYLEELRDSGVDALPFAGPDTESIPAFPAATDEGSPVSTAVTESLEEIRKELGECLRCELGKKRTNLVFGVGNPHARLVFVGEAPGRDEDLQGEPFVGEAGQILTRLINRMGFTRQDVYICNVLKCRPPNNRDPQKDEIEQCGPFMLRQVKAIGPEVVVALGAFAAHTLLQSTVPISKLRGRFHDYHGIPLMPTYHPSFLLRNRGNNAVYWTVWEDMVQVLQKLNMPVPEVTRKG